MTASYHRESPAMKSRKEILLGLRDKMGDRQFSDFIIDTLSYQGMRASQTQINDLPCLSEIWNARIAAREALQSRKRLISRGIPDDA